MVKASDIGRVIVGLAILAAIAGVILLRVVHAPKTPRPRPEPVAEGCGGPGWEAAIKANTASLDTLAWTPFGRAETGWATYAPLVAHEAGTACPPTTPGFAAALARWQARRRLPSDGVFRPEAFDAMRDAMNLRRPFVQATARGLCPAAPSESALATVPPGEAFGDKPIQLRADALAAYHRMAAAARTAGVAGGEVLKVVSGYRGPAEEAARCVDGSCNTLTRAHCSAHRTGLALDLFLDHLPGHDPTSTDDANRAAMAQSPAYRWLVRHAGDFGFLPYPYEPWHWEWTSAPP